ncbi:hypothetical protein [Faecalicoccus pleomorphus]|nr:hypothetical protein [Faecalicoccus pleomorphus]MDM8293403.1 hypothetical protein [Faecalicoccus pleomorphus]
MTKKKGITMNKRFTNQGLFHGQGEQNLEIEKRIRKSPRHKK